MAALVVNAFQKHPWKDYLLPFFSERCTFISSSANISQVEAEPDLLRAYFWRGKACITGETVKNVKITACFQSIFLHALPSRGQKKNPLFGRRKKGTRRKFLPLYINKENHKIINLMSWFKCENLQTKG